MLQTLKRACLQKQLVFRVDVQRAEPEVQELPERVWSSGVQPVRERRGRRVDRRTGAEQLHRARAHPPQQVSREVETHTRRTVRGEVSPQPLLITKAMGIDQLGLWTPCTLSVVGNPTPLARLKSSLPKAGKDVVLGHLSVCSVVNLMSSFQYPEKVLMVLRCSHPYNPGYALPDQTLIPGLVLPLSSHYI